MEIIKRIKSETPSFFKKLRCAAVIIGIIASSILGAHKTGELNFPEWMIEISKYIAFMSATAAMIAQTTKTDKK